MVVRKETSSTQSLRTRRQWLVGLASQHPRHRTETEYLGIKFKSFYFLSRAWELPLFHCAPDPKVARTGSFTQPRYLFRWCSFMKTDTVRRGNFDLIDREKFTSTSLVFAKIEFYSCVIFWTFRTNDFQDHNHHHIKFLRNIKNCSI